MSEVHIEYSNNLKFAPANGGYPEQGNHFKSANLDASHNLWYDIFDHNDPLKTHANWSLLPESEYEEPWFPNGVPCEPHVPRTLPGSVKRAEEPNSSMQSFSVDQLIKDASGVNVSSVPPPTSLLPPSPPPVSEDPLELVIKKFATLSGDLSV